MTMPILTTKLCIPPVRRNLVPRPRLIEQLNAGLQCKLTLVSAPAGFGKTTLLSEWATGAERPVAWLSLDKDDNDLARFLAYLITSLRTLVVPVPPVPSASEGSRIEGAVANLGEGALRALQSPQPPPAEAILSTFINDLVAIPIAIVLIFDDYHLHRNPARSRGCHLSARTLATTDVPGHRQP